MNVTSAARTMMSKWSVCSLGCTGPVFGLDKQRLINRPPTIQAATIGYASQFILSVGIRLPLSASWRSSLLPDVFFWLVGLRRASLGFSGSRALARLDRDAMASEHFEPGFDFGFGHRVLATLSIEP